MARILFVDDDPYTLETLTKAVQIFGHQALLAGNGQDALVLAAEQSPDLIFLDMSLPDMDGIDLTGLLIAQESTAHIPVLILSAGPEADAGEQAKAAGARAYLSKPIRLQTLLDAIQEYAAQ
ncbi:MAG TPA: response regulator [Anaerolineales bacterium]